LATRSALSPPCLRLPLNPDYRCNQCGIKFQTLPYFHWTANIWTADCRYVSNLTNPLVYEQFRWSLYQELWQQHADCLPPFPSSTNLDELKEYGLGRYSMERWLFSHPLMLPCDTTPLKLGRFERGFESWFIPKLRQHPFTMANLNETMQLYFLQQEHQRLYPGMDLTPTLQNYTSSIQEQLQRHGPCTTTNNNTTTTTTTTATTQHLLPKVSTYVSLSLLLCLSVSLALSCLLLVPVDWQGSRTEIWEGSVWNNDDTDAWQMTYFGDWYFHVGGNRHLSSNWLSRVLHSEAPVGFNLSLVSKVPVPWFNRNTVRGNLLSISLFLLQYILTWLYLV